MPGGDLEQHRQALFDLSERLLGDYTKNLESRAGPFDQKEFNDPIWQTIVIQPLEIAILDSPLLQRLRLIRQLGVVHWIYPGATHTRFEHTLGVIHQVQNLISAINKRSAEAERLVISVPMTNLMRLIALCHDVGHGVMSHVSENALKNSLLMEDVLLEFRDSVREERVKPSELAAYYIVESPAFRRLLAIVQEKHRQHQLPDDPVPYIQKAIIGKQISDKIPLLHELINGPFDADKLDYMPRDARMTGVPVVTDIPRLIQKVRAVEIPQERLPERVARGVTGGLASYWMTGIALSGGRTLDELMLGRTLLFDKIYRHQKVRAAESMVAAILENLLRILPTSPAMLPFRIVDDQLINLGRAEVESLAGRQLSEKDAQAGAVVSDIAKRLRERRLFVRAFAFSQHMPLDPYGGDTRQRAGLDWLIREARDPQRRGVLVHRIAAEVRKILRVLGREDLLYDFPEQVIASYIWIDPPEAPSHGSEVDNAHLITPNGEVLRFKEDTAEARAWTDAYLLARDLGYVFTVRKLSPFVFLAAEKEVRKSFDVRIPRSMIDYAKQSEPSIEDFRRRLAETSYYDDSPLDLLPIPVRLTRADVRNRLDKLVDRLKGYAGPYGTELTGAKSDRTIRRERIEDWIRQFSGEDLIDAALDTVTKVRLIGRTDIIRAMKVFLEARPEFKEAFVCPLGRPNESSAVYTYLAGDVLPDYALKILPLADALAENSSRPIVFVEDFIGSGKQPVTIIEGMLGEVLSYDLGEERRPLPDPLKGILRDRQLGFVFAAGMDEGLERLEARAKDLNLAATVVAAIKERELPKAFQEGKLSGSQERFRAECIRIGHALLDDGESRHDTDWIKGKALGYGNLGLLVVFPFNTPAQTLTCLWAEGKVGNRDWSSVFPRRKKK